MTNRWLHRLGRTAAVALLAAACTDRLPTDAGPGPSSTEVRLDVVSGNGQSATAGTELPGPLVVRVLDGAGTPVSGRILNFRVIDGDGSVFAGIALTNGSGIAQERWVLGPTPGTDQTVEVRAVDSDTGTPIVYAVFRATALGTVETVSVAPAYTSVEVGDSPRFTATLRDAGGRVLTGNSVAWTSSDPGVATVAADGTVTTLSGGTATITATSGERSGSASLTVTAPVRTVTVAPASSRIMVLQSVQLSATTRDRVGNVLQGRVVTWTSSNNAIATVDSNGRVTGRLPGTVTIRATSEGQSGTATVTISTLPPL